VPKRGKESYTQSSFLTKTPVEVSPKKTFASLGGTRLGEFMELKNPAGWIAEHGLRFLLAGKEKSLVQSQGTSIHEGGYFYLLIAENPLPPGKDVFLHAQEVAKLHLPARFPTANKADLQRREMILTAHLPEVWPKVGEDLDGNSTKKLFDIVHQNTLYPHPPNQPHLTKVGPDITFDGVHCLRNLARFYREDLLSRISDSEYTVCEFTMIQFFRSLWNIKVTSMADLLIISKSVRGDGVPIWTYDLFDIKSGKRVYEQTKIYSDYLYQLWIMKRVLERTSPDQIQEAINKREALRLETGNSPIETVRVNCYLVWPGEYWHPKETCELVNLPDDDVTERKLYRCLTLYRQLKDGKLRKGLASNRELLLGKK